MKLYTLTAYLNDVKIGFGTVLEDYTEDDLACQADKWFGKDRWNRLEIDYYREAAE